MRKVWDVVQGCAVVFVVLCLVSVCGLSFITLKGCTKVASDLVTTPWPTTSMQQRVDTQATAFKEFDKEATAFKQVQQTRVAEERTPQP